MTMTFLEQRYYPFDSRDSADNLRYLIVYPIESGPLNHKGTKKGGRYEERYQDPLS